MNTIVYEETLTGRPHDTSVQKATSDKEMWMQFNVMPRTPEVSALISSTAISHYINSAFSKLNHWQSAH